MQLRVQSHHAGQNQRRFQRKVATLHCSDQVRAVHQRELRDFAILIERHQTVGHRANVPVDVLDDITGAGAVDGGASGSQPAAVAQALKVCDCSPASSQVSRCSAV